MRQRTWVAWACLAVTIVLLATGLQSVRAESGNSSIPIGPSFPRDEDCVYGSPTLARNVLDDADYSGTHSEVNFVRTAWDSSNLYFDVFNNQSFWLGTVSGLFIALDTGPGGASDGQNGTDIAFTGAARPDWLVVIDDTLPGAYSLLRWNATSGSWQPRPSGLYAAGGGGQHVEVSVPLADIGSPSAMNYSVFTVLRSGNGVPDHNRGAAYSQVVVDQSLDSDYGAPLAAVSLPGYVGANVSRLYSTYDSSRLYVAMNATNTASWNVAYGFALDADGSSTWGYQGGGSPSDAWSRSIGFVSPYLPDYEVYFYWDGASGSITSAQLCNWTGSGWNYHDLVRGSDYNYTGDSSNGLEFVEFGLLLDDLLGGSPTPRAVRLNGFAAGSGPGSSAVTCAPYDPTINDSGSEWTDTDYFSRFVELDIDRPACRDKAPEFGNVSTTGYPTNITQFVALSGLDTPNAPDNWIKADGIVAKGGWRYDEFMGTDATKQFWLTWNATRLILGWQDTDWGSSADPAIGDGDLLVHIGTGGSGTYYTCSWNGGTDTLAFPEQYIFWVENGYLPSNHGLAKYDPATWTWSNAPYTGECYIGNSLSRNTTITIPWTDLGNPTQLELAVVAKWETARNTWASFPVQNPVGAGGLYFPYFYRFTSLAAGLHPNDPSYVVLDTKAPTVVSTSPTNGQSVDPSSIDVAFSEPMNTTATTAAFSIQPLLAGSVLWFGQNLSYSIAGSLQPSAWYNVTVSTAAKDVAGNPLASTFRFSFNTTSGVKPRFPPRVLSTVPADTATGVPVNTSITVVFNASMTQASVQSAISSSPLRTPANFAWSPGGSTVSFNLTSNLDYSTRYTITVSTAALDVNGTAMARPYMFNFTTESAPQPGQTGNLTGIVTSSASGAAIQDATVTLTYSSNSTPLGSESTDVAGNYRFSDIPATGYSMTVTKSGYDSFGPALVSVAAGMTTTRNVQLTPSAMPALEVSVEADPPDMEPGGSTTVTAAVTSTGNPVSGATVAFAASSASVTLSVGSAPTGPSGLASMTLTASTTASSGTVTVWANATKSGYLDGTGSTDVTITTVRLTVRLSATRTNITSGEAVLVSVTVRSALNNAAVSAATVTLTATGGGSFQPASGTTASNGTFVAWYTAPMTTSQLVVTLRADAQKVGCVSGTNSTTVTVRPVTQPPVNPPPPGDGGTTLWIAVGVAAAGSVVAVLILMLLSRRRRRKDRPRSLRLSESNRSR